jgi:hypothetical protein
VEKELSILEGKHISEAFSIIGSPPERKELGELFYIKQ